MGFFPELSCTFGKWYIILFSCFAFVSFLCNFNANFNSVGVFAPGGDPTSKIDSGFPLNCPHYTDSSVVCSFPLVQNWLYPVLNIFRIVSVTELAVPLSEVLASESHRECVLNCVGEPGRVLCLLSSGSLEYNGFTCIVFLVPLGSIESHP